MKMPRYNPNDWFEDIPVIGKMTASEAARKLQELSETDSGGKVRRGKSEKRWLWSDRTVPWQYTSHTFGFIPSSNLNSTNQVEIKHAGNIEPDHSLKNSRIKITLDRLRVFDYPGSGIHYILFDFYAQNQVQSQTEHIHFNQIYRVQGGEQAGIIGYPIFIGLNVGSDGVAFRCYTVNVKNENDERLLEFLEGDTFKNGLKLIETVNPLVPIISSVAIGLTKMIARRNKNIPVQDFYMGLDFTKTPTRARLSQGSYIAVQIPEAEKWDWSKWVFNPPNGQIVSKNNPTEAMPYNYLVFSVSNVSD
jgi:hypothetical protein